MQQGAIIQCGPRNITVQSVISASSPKRGFPNYPPYFSEIDATFSLICGTGKKHMGVVDNRNGIFAWCFPIPESLIAILEENDEISLNMLCILEVRTMCMVEGKDDI